MYDFVVIGGGIAGISAGARLSQLGTVCALEAEDALAYHASGRSAAMYEATYGAPSVIALNLASREYHETANGGVLSPRGLMIVGGQGQDQELAHDLVTMKMDPLSTDEALDLFPILNPDAMIGAGYHADGWDIDTDLLLQNFARDIRVNGQVHTRAKVTDITRLSHGWEVTTPKMTVQCKTLVNAAGPWVDQVAAMAGIQPIGIQPLSPVHGTNCRARGHGCVEVANGDGGGRKLVCEAGRRCAHRLPRGRRPDGAARRLGG